jgi:hypothetical protein
MTINEYDGKLPVEVEAEIIALCEACKMGENYDTACDLVYIWIKDEKIVGVIAFKLYKFTDGRELPRIQHVIFHPDYASKKKARSSFLFLRKVFVMVGKKYSQCWAYVVSSIPIEQYMKQMAIKLGFKKYSEDKDGEYFALQLT